MPLSEYVVRLPAGHREGTGDAEEVDPLVLEVELGVTTGGEVRLWDSLELDKLDEVTDWVETVLDEDDEVDMVEEPTGELAELVCVVDGVSFPVDWDDPLSVDELGEEVAVIVIEVESPREELLPRTSEVTLDVLTPVSLDNDDDVLTPGSPVDDDDVGMAEVLPMSLDADEDEETLSDCELLTVEDRDDTLLEPADWLEDVVASMDALILEPEEIIELEELTSLEDESELLWVELIPDDELIELEVKVGTVLWALDDVVVDDTAWGLELALVVPLTELEVDTKRVLLCVEESWLEAVDDSAVLVNDSAEVENESELSVEETANELEETAVEEVPSTGW
jgi:hypothetical protein